VFNGFTFCVVRSAKGLELLQSVCANQEVSTDPRSLLAADSLELVCTSLPFSSKLHPHLHASEHVFEAALIVDTELKHISILYSESDKKIGKL